MGYFEASRQRAIRNTKNLEKLAKELKTHDCIVYLPKGEDKSFIRAFKWEYELYMQWESLEHVWRIIKTGKTFIQDEPPTVEELLQNFYEGNKLFDPEELDQIYFYLERV